MQKKSFVEYNCNSVFSFNRVFLLSLGSVCLLIIAFFWIALAFDYKALENFMTSLTQKKFVGYSIPSLFGSDSNDSVVSQVFRLKIFFSLFLFSYSLFFIFLYGIEETRKRLNFLARGISIPLFFLLVVFWQKFITDDHIITKSEKAELFILTIISLVICILLFSYSSRSKKKFVEANIPNSVKAQTSQVINTNQSTDSTPKDADNDQPNQSTDQFVVKSVEPDGQKSTPEINQSTAVDSAESAEINDDSSVLEEKTEMENVVPDDTVDQSNLSNSNDNTLSESLSIDDKPASENIDENTSENDPNTENEEVNKFENLDLNIQDDNPSK